MAEKLRRRLYELLERPQRATRANRLVEGFLIVLITLNVIAVVLETVQSLHTRFTVAFHYFELFSVTVFTLEYLSRLWVCIEEPGPHGPARKRLSYALTPVALVDLIAILPFYLAFFFAVDLRFLRVLRLLRIFKLTRYSSALTMLLDVFREEASSFVAAFFILAVMLVLASSGAYLVEHQAQPDKFGSIPAAMWWAVATLTTVGYGDVTPLTAMGKVFGALITVIGVGMAALPAGILASGLADQLRRKRERLSDELRAALDDGIIDAEEESELEALRKELGLNRRIAAEIREEALELQNAERGTCPHCGKLLHHAHTLRSNEP